jgi:hypothetical protein
MAALLRENVQARGERLESLTTQNTTVSGTPAVRLSYVQPARKRAVEYGFVKNGYFFYLLFQTIDGPDYARELKDFQRVVSTFKVLD